MSILFNKEDSDGVLFCLDKNSLIIEQTNTSSKFVKILIKMRFKGYLREFQVEQEYEYVFFDKKVEVFPGEDVQDFFMEVNSASALGLESVDSLNMLFNTAIVDFEISENGNKTEFKKYSLKNLFFLPGKRPLAFPCLTNSKERSVYKKSLILLSALGSSFKSMDYINLLNINEEKGVYCLSYRYSSTSDFAKSVKGIARLLLSFEPFPEPADCIDVVFVNQNLCPDWLSFSGEWERHPELNHILSNNKRGVVFKAKVESKSVLKLNTGWLLEEEVVLVEELMKSKFCFVKLKEKWMRCIPISKKPLAYNSDRNVNSQIVEFQIDEENER